MSTFRAMVDRRPFEMGTRLYIIEDRYPYAPNRMLMGDGTWTEVPDGVDLSGSGVIIPDDAIQPVAEALARHLGDTFPSAAEVRVLRESLDLERARVDRVLEAR